MKLESEHTNETEATPELVDAPLRKATAWKALRFVGWIAAWLVGAFLGLLLFSDSSDLAVLPVESFTGVSSGIKDLDSFALGRCAGAIALVAAFVLLWRLFRRRNAGSLAKFLATLAVGAFYSVVTLAYLPEIGPMNLMTGGSWTVYGKGFSRSGFKKIQPGMTKAEVAALVGEGVDINARWLEIDREQHYSDQTATWFLSGPGPFENYWQYGVSFTTNGVVDRTWCQFWYD